MSSPSSVGSPDTPGDLLAQPNGTHDHPDPDAVDSTHAPPPAAPAAPPPDEFDTAIFPAPPAFYHRYTQRNLALPPDATISDVPGEPRPFSRADLDPPNVDWIIEDGSYAVFGETWPIDEKLPTLEDMGVAEMFDRDAGAPHPPSLPPVLLQRRRLARSRALIVPAHDTDRKTSLQSLLRTLIITYTQLLDALLTPPPSLAHPQPPRSDVERLTEHMRLVAINMHYLVNELRPVQVRALALSSGRREADDCFRMPCRRAKRSRQ